jgi:hypothetical protein
MKKSRNLFIKYFHFYIQGIQSPDNRLNLLAIKAVNNILVNIAYNSSNSLESEGLYFGFGLLMKDASSIISLLINKNIIQNLVVFLSYTEKYIIDIDHIYFPC